MLVSVCISFLLVEPSDISKVDESIEIKEYLTASVHFFRNHPSVCLVVLSGMVTGAALNFIDEFWQLYLERLGIPVLYSDYFRLAL